MGLGAGWGWHFFFLLGCCALLVGLLLWLLMYTVVDTKGAITCVLGRWAAAYTGATGFIHLRIPIQLLFLVLVRALRAAFVMLVRALAEILGIWTSRALSFVIVV